MVRIISGYAVFVFLLFSCLITLAEVEENIRNANRLLELSGITKQIGEFPGLIKTGMEESRKQGAPIPDSLFQAMLMSVDDSTDINRMVKGVAKELQDNLSEEEIQYLFSWYESELGKKITMLEEKSSTTTAYKEMVQMGDSLLADSDRVNFARKLDDLVGATDFSMKLQENTQTAVLSSVFKALNPHKPFDLKALKSQMSKHRAEIRASIKKIVIISFIYTYKDLNEEEIDQYTNFLESAASKNFNNSTIRGIGKEMNKALMRLGKSMAIILQSKVRQG